MNARTRETHPLTWRLDHEQPMTAIAAYETLDGYAAVRKALPGIVQRLRAKGYVFVSLDELLGRTRPGRVYRQR